MSYLEEHSYGSLPQIKKEIDKSPSPVPELDIKLECESHSGDSRASPLFIEAPSDQVFTHTFLKQEVDADENGHSEDELQKACIVQACLKLLDSSSSDDDELLLYWMLCKNKKKNLRKRRRMS